MLDDPVAMAQDEPRLPPDESDPAVVRFRACRWHQELSDSTEYCGHSDVKPYAGQHDFKPAAWCPECTYYKARRKAKKNEFDEYGC